MAGAPTVWTVGVAQALKLTLRLAIVHIVIPMRREKKCAELSGFQGDKKVHESTKSSYYFSCFETTCSMFVYVLYILRIEATSYFICRQRKQAADNWAAGKCAKREGLTLCARTPSGDDQTHEQDFQTVLLLAGDYLFVGKKKVCACLVLVVLAFYFEVSAGQRVESPKP